MRNEEPNPLVGTTRTMLLKSGPTARGYRPGMGLLAPSSRLFTVMLMLKNIRASMRNYRARAAMNNDDACAHERWSERSALSNLSNIVASLQYCPKVFISARRGKNRSSFFFRLSGVIRAALPDRGEAKGWI